MIFQFLACVGDSHLSYRVLAIRDNFEQARQVLETYTGPTKEKPPVGFVQCWETSATTTSKASSSEAGEHVFVWDTRHQMKNVVKRKLGPW